MVQPRHPAHHTRAARPVLSRDTVGQPTCRRAWAGGRVRALVSQGAADLQRRSRAGPVRTLGHTAFRHLAADRDSTKCPGRARRALAAHRLPPAMTTMPVRPRHDTCKAKLSRWPEISYQVPEPEVLRGHPGLTARLLGFQSQYPFCGIAG